MKWFFKEEEVPKIEFIESFETIKDKEFIPIVYLNNGLEFTLKSIRGYSYDDIIYTHTDKPNQITNGGFYLAKYKIQDWNLNRSDLVDDYLTKDGYKHIKIMYDSINHIKFNEGNEYELTRKVLKVKE